MSMLERIKAGASTLWAKLKGSVHSWTIRINAAFGTALLAAPYLKDNLGALKPYVNDTLFNHTAAVLILINIALRFKTDRALEHRGKPS